MPSTAQNFYPGTSQAAGNPAHVLDLLTTNAQAADSTTSCTFTATAAAWEQIVPLTAISATVAASPAVGAAAANNGWRMLQSDVGSTAADERITPSGAWTQDFLAAIAAPAVATSISATLLTIFYSVDSGGVSTELWRGSVAISVAIAGNYKFTVTSPTEPIFIVPAGGSIQLEAWINSGATANTLGAITNTVINIALQGGVTTDSVLPAPGLRTLYLQSPSDTLLTTDTLTRQVNYLRSASDTLLTTDTLTRSFVGARSSSDAILTSETLTRTVLYPRAEADTTALSDAATRQASYFRSESDITTLADSLARSFTGARRQSDVIALSDAATRQGAFARADSDALPLSEAVTRAVAYPRAESDALPLSDVLTRSLAAARPTSDTTALSDSLTRLITYGRHQYENIGNVPQDYQGQSPFKKITGFVYNSTGTVQSGITLYLVREADNAVVATTTSAADGSYSFTRDTTDPNVYHLVADTTVSGTQLHGTSDFGLVPA